MLLTDTAIKKIQPKETVQKPPDGHGLQLHVTPQGSKLWRWAYRKNPL